MEPDILLQVLTMVVILRHMSMELLNPMVVRIQQQLLPIQLHIMVIPHLMLHLMLHLTLHHMLHLIMVIHHLIMQLQCQRLMELMELFQEWSMCKKSSTKPCTHCVKELMLVPFVVDGKPIRECFMFEINLYPSF